MSIPGVKILIDGKKKAKTNEKGIYTIPEISPGQYRIEAEKPNYIFETYTVQVKPNTRKFPFIYVKGVQVCGKLSLDSNEKKDFNLNKRAISLKETGSLER